GVTPEDQQVAIKLRGIDRPVLLVANKVDGESREADAWELMKLGLGEPYTISALHGRNTGDLRDEIVALLPAEDAPPVAGDDEEDGGDELDPDREVAAVALVGRPNVGKSTLFNRLIGDERAVVHDMPGTT